jgi:hypothetical protein
VSAKHRFSLVQGDEWFAYAAGMLEGRNTRRHLEAKHSNT